MISSEVVDINGQGHGALAGIMNALHVDVLICGGTGGDCTALDVNKAARTRQRRLCWPENSPMIRKPIVTIVAAGRGIMAAAITGGSIDPRHVPRPKDGRDRPRHH